MPPTPRAAGPCGIRTPRSPPVSETAAPPESGCRRSTRARVRPAARAPCGSTSRIALRPAAQARPPPIPATSSASYRRPHHRDAIGVAQEDQHQHDTEDQHGEERQEQTEALELEVHEVGDDERGLDHRETETPGLYIDIEERPDSAQQMDRVSHTQHVEKGTARIGGNEDAGGVQLIPGEGLPGKKEHAESGAGGPPAVEPGARAGFERAAG